MKWKLSQQKSFFPWERRGGVLRGLGLYRLGRLLGLGLVAAFLVVVALRERTQSGVRQTRALLGDVREAIDGYRSDHRGQCPESFEQLADYGPVRGTPRDAWGQPLTLICSGRAGDPYRLMSAGPDGLPGGLDRIE